jgi:hypothetical protein
MSSNEPKLMSKCQLFYNSCYICLYGAILMAWESWKVVLIEYYNINKFKMSKKNSNIKVWFEQRMFNDFIQ